MDNVFCYSIQKVLGIFVIDILINRNYIIGDMINLSCMDELKQKSSVKILLI